MRNCCTFFATVNRVHSSDTASFLFPSYDCVVDVCKNDDKKIIYAAISSLPAAAAAAAVIDDVR